jgi:hypothetical protein
MENNTNNENSLNEMTIKMSEREIKDLKRFWEDLEWYERESSINNAFETAEKASKPIIRSAIIPEDLKKRCETAIENLNTLKVLNDKEKPSKISLRILEVRTKIGLTTYEEKKDTSPNLRMCLVAIHNLSNNDRARLDKYLGIENIVKQARAHSHSYGETYLALFSEPSYTSLTMFFAFSNYIKKYGHFQ